MPLKCQAVYCRSGYNPTDAEKAELDAGRIPECRAHTIKKFPEDPALTNKWIAVLHRDPKEVNIKSGGVCTKHFLESDFLSGTTMRGGERKNRRLKKSAIPSLFPNYPPFAQPSPVEKRPTTMSTRQARQDSANKRIQEEVDEFLAVDKVSTLDDLYQKLLQEKLPTGYSLHWYTDPNNLASKVLACQHMVPHKDYNHVVAHTLLVKPDLSFKLFVDGTSVGHVQVRHLVRDKFHLVSQVLNVMSLLSTVEGTATDRFAKGPFSSEQEKLVVPKMNQFIPEIKEEDEIKIEEEDIPSTLISNSSLTPQHQSLTWRKNRNEAREKSDEVKTAVFMLEEDEIKIEEEDVSPSEDPLALCHSWKEDEKEVRVKKHKIKVRTKDACLLQEPSTFTEGMVLATPMMGADQKMPGQDQEYGVVPASVIQSISPDLASHQSLLQSPSFTPSLPVISSTPERIVLKPRKRKVASACDSMWERQINECRQKQKYWKLQLEMLEEERNFQRKIWEQKLKEAERDSKFIETLPQRMEQSFDNLNRFLESAKAAYEAYE